MLFTTSDISEMLPNLAWGHRGGISIGVFAVVFLVLFALFLYSIIVQRPRYSIIPLFIASTILMIRSICAKSGYLFLPEWMITLFTKPELLWFLLIAYISYLARHYKRIKLIRYCSLGSISIFIGAYLISLFTNGHFSRFVNDLMNTLLLSQDYTTTLLWMNILLQFICLLVAGITTMTSISKNFFIFLSLPFKIVLF